MLSLTIEHSVKGNQENKKGNRRTKRETEEQKGNQKNETGTRRTKSKTEEQKGN